MAILEDADRQTGQAETFRPADQLLVQLRLLIGQESDPDTIGGGFVLTQQLIQLDQESAQRFIRLTGEDDDRGPILRFSDETMVLTTLTADADDGHVRGQPLTGFRPVGGRLAWQQEQTAHQDEFPHGATPWMRVADDRPCRSRATNSPCKRSSWPGSAWAQNRCASWR